jgi:hypothetical protein
MTTPVTIPPPPSLPTGTKSFPIYTMPFAEYFAMSAKDMQDIFREYPVIVVKDMPTRLQYTLESLEEWGDPDELRVMHGVLYEPCLKEVLTFF